jgi:hypothetical protein
MTEPDEAKILRRAKELCEQDGFAWEMEFGPRPPKYSPIMLQPVLLDDAARDKYLARAREQLLEIMQR